MNKAQPAGRIDVISDAICPWCYIGKVGSSNGRSTCWRSTTCRFTVAWHPSSSIPTCRARASTGRAGTARAVRQRRTVAPARRADHRSGSQCPGL